MGRKKKPISMKKAYVVAARFTAREYSALETCAMHRHETVAELVERAAVALAKIVIADINEEMESTNEAVRQLQSGTD